MCALANDSGKNDVSLNALYVSLIEEESFQHNLVRVIAQNAAQCQST